MWNMLLTKDAGPPASAPSPGAFQTPAEGAFLKTGSVTGSVFVWEKAMDATDRDYTGSQVIKGAFVSLDFHRKKWKKLPGEKHSKALLFWPSKEEH